MKRHYLKICVMLALVVLVSSCVKEEYDFDKLDLTVNVGGENLAFPLGSTDSIKIKKLLNTEELGFLQKYEGAYALRLSDTIDYDLSAKLPDLKDKLKIDGKDYPKDFGFSLGSLTTDNFRIPLISENKSIKPGFPTINVADINIPTINNNTVKNPDIAQYKPSQSQLTISDVNMNLAKNPFNLDEMTLSHLESLSGDPVEIGTLPAFPISQSSTFPITMTLPDDVSNIGNIKLSDRAVIEITMELKDPVLSSGAISPNITFNPSDLFTLSDGTVPVSVPLTLNTPLNAANNYKAEYTYKVASLNIASTDWTDNTLTLTKDVSIGGSVTFSEATVAKAQIRYINSMGILVTAVVKNLEIESVDLDIPQIDGSSSQTVNFNLPEYTLPEQVKTIETINFEAGSSITLTITKDNMTELLGVDVNAHLDLTLPPELIVPGGNVISRDIAILGSESTKSVVIPVDGYDLSGHTPISGKIPAILNTIPYSFNYRISGRLSTEDIPENPSLTMQLTSSLNFDNASLRTNDFNQEMDDVNFDFSVEVPDDVSGYGKITVVPAGDPYVTIGISVPTLPVSYEIPSTGLVVNLPSMFSFKNVPAGYNYNPENNTITLQGTIPSSILLPIDKIASEAVKKGDKYYFDSAISMEGGILLKEGPVNTDDLDGLNDKSIGLTLSMPEIVPGSISPASLKFDMKEKTPVPIEITGINEIYSLDSVLVDGAQLSLNVTLEQFPDIGASPINVDIYVELPPSFMFNDPRIDEDNKMHLQGTFTNNSFSITPPITIIGLAFDGEPLNGAISLKDTIAINGAITVDNPIISSVSAVGNNVQVKLLASISAFTPSELYGKVQYDMDPVNETLPLDNIPAFLRSEECVLDVANPHIALTLESNVGIPLSGTLNITPYIGGEVNSNGVQNIPISIPKYDPDHPIVGYWIANDESLTPAPEGYTFIQSDIAALIKTIPSKIEISIDANIDMTQQHYINVETQYGIKFNYDLVVPLMFGEEFQISLRDTLNNMPEFLTETLRSSKLGLAGTIENSLPLQLELELQALDANKNLIPLKSSKQTILACKPDGSPTISNLDIKLSADGNTNFNAIASLVLSFKVTSPNISGIPITDESFVRADLNVLIEGGITLDLNK